jgi:phosphate starvation-inducible membrane PsiE
MKDTPPNVAENRIRVHSSSFWRTLEAGIYTAVACVLALTAIVALTGSGRVLWEGLRTWDSSETMLRIIDRLLLVLMLVEILHTVRISIRSHVLVTEPFLIVGLIATIRRILVITLEAANLSRPETWSHGGDAIFHASVIELGLLGFMVLVLVISIYLLRHSPTAPEEDD